jgi:hypothetical protein
MSSIRVEATIEKDGELHLSNLPCSKGDQVEAVVFVKDRAGEKGRTEARERFLTRARASRFRSVGAYPSRDELHERP